ncbi:MAG TPA: alpha/beta fold hydrolase [Terriglobales bacterium]|jgi:pimeloyl-ACP methyl ester carboxylesterase|nr:alpha/beta fold hydrolase [Terriglobales bacterium]
MIFHRRYFLLSAALLFLLSGVVWPQNAAQEYWEGSRTRLGKSQAFSLRVEHSQGKDKAVVDFPHYGALDVPAAQFVMKDGRIHFELVGDSSNAVFDGAVAPNSLDGTWKEDEQTGEFHLRRAAQPGRQWREEEISFQNGEVRLGGTLLLPNGDVRSPAIILVHGAGPEQRYVERFLAQFFVAHGLAALIYDKRGTGASTGDWKRASFEDLAADVVAAVNYLKNRKEVDSAHIGLMGQSQGGWIGPIAANLSKDISFVIVKSAAPVTPEEQELARVETQMRAAGNSEAEIQQALALYQQVIAYARTRQGWDNLAAALQDAQQKSWYFFAKNIPKDWWFFGHIKMTFAHDPIPVLREMRVPVLIIIGGKDSYAPPPQKTLGRLVEALQGSDNLAEIHIFPNAGHALRVEPGKNEPWDFPHFAPGYLELLASWVKLQTAPQAQLSATDAPAATGPLLSHYLTVRELAEF